MFKGKPYKKDAFASLYPINRWKGWDLMGLVESFRKCCFQSSFVHTEFTVGWGEESANLSRVMRGGHGRVRVDYRGRSWADTTTMLTYKYSNYSLSHCLPFRSQISPDFTFYGNFWCISRNKKYMKDLLFFTNIVYRLNNPTSY